MEFNMNVRDSKDQIKKIRELLLEIFERLSLKFSNSFTISNMAIFLQEHHYISQDYSNRLKSLEKIENIKDSKQLNDEINDLRLYLLSKFYHYI